MKSPARAFAAVVVVSGLAVLCVRPAQAARGDCMQPVSDGDRPSVSDCLASLLCVTGTCPCEPACICAPKGSLPVTAVDALICLRIVVGLDSEASCPCQVTTTSEFTGRTFCTVTNTTCTSTMVGSSSTTLSSLDTECLEQDAPSCAP